MSSLGGVGVLVLAAGAGRRMGGEAPKLLLPMPGRVGKSVLRQTVENALQPPFHEVLVALGPRLREHLDDLEPLATRENLRILSNPDHPEGRGATIRAGVLHADPSVEHLLILCGDQPGLGPSLLERLARFHVGNSHAVSFPQRPDGGRGWPTVWSRGLLPELARVSGDAGARPLLRRMAPEAGRLPLTEEELATQGDLDTPEDYRTWTSQSIL